MNLNTSSWKTFLLSYLYTIEMGNKFDKNKMTFENPTINFISRQGNNNGVDSKADVIDGVQPYKAGLMTIALGGQIGSCFVQTEDFYTAQNIVVLKPLFEKMSLEVNLFISTLVRYECKFKYYPFGRELNIHIKRDFSIKLPVTKDGAPDFEFMEQYIKSLHHKPISTQIEKKTMPFNTALWQPFILGELFDIKKGKRLTKADMILGTVNFLGAISENNGVREKIDTEEVWEANCITVNYNGSVGEAFYQEEPFWASDDVNALYPKGWALNKYIALFVCTVIKQERYRFSYGRKWTLEKMHESVIKLPVTPNGKPDWSFMESYIKSLPYSDRI